jgi:hypothetical protein
MFMGKQCFVRDGFALHFKGRRPRLIVLSLRSTSTAETFAEQLAAQTKDQWRAALHLRRDDELSPSKRNHRNTKLYFPSEDHAFLFQFAALTAPDQKAWARAAELLDSPDPELRVRAADAFHDSRRGAAPLVLARLAKEPDVGVAVEIGRRWASQLPADRAEELVKSGLAHDHADVRYDALQIADYLPADPALPLFVPTDEPDVFLKAALAAGATWHRGPTARSPRAGR